MGGSHELKFGFSYRDMKTHSATIYSGNQLTGHINSATNMVARVYRGTDLNYGGKYINVYLGDMFTKDRFTFNIGVRYDIQNAKNLESDGAGQRDLPGSAAGRRSSPATTANLQDWKTFSPRVGLSYALDESRRTIVRASYARYYQQLAFGDVTRENPTSVGLHRVRLERRQRRPVRAAGRGQLQRLPRTRRASTWRTRARSRPTRSTRSTATGSPARTTSSSSASTVSSARASRPAWRSPTARATTGARTVPLQGRVQRPAQPDQGHLPADDRR